MAALTVGKIVEYVFDSFADTFEKQTLMLDLVDAEPGDMAKLQNAGNTAWYPVQQHRPIQAGWDMSGKGLGIIEESYPISLGTPNNDVIEQRVDDLRDQRFWERAGEQAGAQHGTQLNKDLADLIIDTGSLFYRFDTSASQSGFDFISEGQSLITERQAYKTKGCNFMLNVRDSQGFAKDLAARQTLNGRPEEVWKTGQIGQNVDGFDVYKGSFLKNLAGGSAATTLTADVSEAPESGSVNATTKVVTNIDYREGSLPVTSSASFAVGDYITVGAVNSVGLADKTDTGQLMTFKVVGIPDSTTLTIYPKPIAPDDSALSTLEKAYSNISTQMLNTNAVNRVNTDATEKTNIFWAKDSIQLMGGDVPWEMMGVKGGKQVVSKKLTSGVTLYMIYDSDILTGNFTYRLFVWYGLANRNPQANGVAVTY